MEKIARGKRASENQKEYLINFLEENIDIANDKFVTTDGAKFRDEKWKELATSLNALGGTFKDAAKWRKYWSDLRVHTRAKYLEIKQAEQRSGINGIVRLKTLSPLEERVIKISTTEAVDGDGTPEIGFEAIPTFMEQSMDICEHFEGFDVALASESIENPSCSSNAKKSCAPRVGITSVRPRRHKRKLPTETPHLEKLLKIEEQKIAEMVDQNNLKRQEIAIQREQLEATKKQTAAIEASNLIKEMLLERLQSVANYIEEQNP